MRYLSAVGAAACCVILSVSLTSAAELDRAAINIKLPDQIPWVKDPSGALGDTQRATIVGDPSKPGLYVQLIKWAPHNMSRPHFHPNDRFITVLSGTWWVGTGKKYDPDSTVPMHDGSVVTHFAKGIHYDGAKDEPAIIEIVGMGPATVIGAEEK